MIQAGQVQPLHVEVQAGRAVERIAPVDSEAQAAGSRSNDSEVTEGEPVRIPRHRCRTAQIPTLVREAQSHLIDVQDALHRVGLEGDAREVVFRLVTPEKNVQRAPRLPVLQPSASTRERSPQNAQRVGLDIDLDPGLPAGEPGGIERDVGRTHGVPAQDTMIERGGPGDRKRVKAAVQRHPAHEATTDADLFAQWQGVQIDAVDEQTLSFQGR